jgi:hypothetical protein
MEVTVTNIVYTSANGSQVASVFGAYAVYVPFNSGANLYNFASADDAIQYADSI